MADKIFNKLVQPDDIEMIDESTEKDRWMQEVSKQIFSKNDIELKTDINTMQINALTKGLLYAETYNVSIMKNLCDWQMILAVSKDRRSRKEFTEISKNLQPDPGELTPSLKQRLLG
jgi:hypothetical protein